MQFRGRHLGLCLPWHRCQGPLFELSRTSEKKTKATGLARGSVSQAVGPQGRVLTSPPPPSTSESSGPSREGQLTHILARQGCPG